MVIPGQDGDDNEGQAGDDNEGQDGDDKEGHAGDDNNGHARPDRASVFYRMDKSLVILGYICGKGGMTWRRTLYLRRQKDM